MGPGNRTSFICIITLIALVALSAQLAAAEDQPPAGEPRVAFGRNGRTIEVMPLDAWDNPYRGQYGEWDYWVWEHFDPALNLTDLGS